MIQALLVFAIFACSAAIVACFFLSNDTARRAVADLVTHSLLIVQGAARTAQRHQLTNALIEHAVLTPNSERISKRKILLISLFSSSFFVAGLSAKFLTTLNESSHFAKVLGGGAFGAVLASIIAFSTILLGHFLYDYTCALAHVTVWRRLQNSSATVRFFALTLACLLLLFAPFGLAWVAFSFAIPGASVELGRTPDWLILLAAVLLFDGPVVFVLLLVTFIILGTDPSGAPFSLPLLFLSCLFSYAVFLLVFFVDSLLSFDWSARAVYKLAQRIPIGAARLWQPRLLVALALLTAVASLLGVTTPLK